MYGFQMSLGIKKFYDKFNISHTGVIIGGLLNFFATAAVILHIVILFQGAERMVSVCIFCCSGSHRNSAELQNSSGKNCRGRCQIHSRAYYSAHYLRACLCLLTPQHERYFICVNDPQKGKINSVKAEKYGRNEMFMTASHRSIDQITDDMIAEAESKFMPMLWIQVLTRLYGSDR